MDVTAIIPTLGDRSEMLSEATIWYTVKRLEWTELSLSWMVAKRH